MPFNCKVLQSLKNWHALCNYINNEEFTCRGAERDLHHSVSGNVKQKNHKGGISMCTGTKIEEKSTSGCSGKCSGSGQAKLSEPELQKQQQECHGVQTNSTDTVAVESK
jgi:hypothetical protein